MALLKDVAAACGLSVTTVSDALRGTGKVSPATRVRVRETAARLGYSPDPMAAGLRARRFSQARDHQGLSVVITSARPDGTVPALVARRARELGYACRFEELPQNPDAVAARLRRWRRQGVGGIVFQGAQIFAALDLPEWRHFGLVACTGTAQPPPCHHVTTDAAVSVVLCARVLREKGYRALGLAVLSHDPEIVDDHRRHAAALLAQMAAGPGERQVPIFREPMNAPTTPSRFLDWFERHRPDAIVGFNHMLWYWLDAAGWSCPRDYAFATLHHLPHAPEFSGHDPMHEECARVTMELLDQLIRYRETGWPQLPRVTTIGSRWIERESTPLALGHR